MLLALYHHCCPAVRVWLSIRSWPAFAQPPIRWGERAREKENEGKEAEGGSQVYTSCCGGASRWKEQTSGGGYLIKEGTSSN